MVVVLQFPIRIYNLVNFNNNVRKIFKIIKLINLCVNIYKMELLINAE